MAATFLLQGRSLLLLATQSKYRLAVIHNAGPLTELLQLLHLLPPVVYFYIHAQLCYMDDARLHLISNTAIDAERHCLKMRSGNAPPR